VGDGRLGKASSWSRRRVFELFSSLQSTPTCCLKAGCLWSRSACTSGAVGRFAGANQLSHLTPPPGCPRRRLHALLLKDPAPGGRSSAGAVRSSFQARRPSCSTIRSGVSRTQAQVSTANARLVWEPTASVVPGFSGQQPLTSLQRRLAVITRRRGPRAPEPLSLTSGIDSRSWRSMPILQGHGAAGQDRKATLETHLETNRPSNSTDSTFACIGPSGTAQLYRAHAPRWGW